MPPRGGQHGAGRVNNTDLLHRLLESPPADVRLLIGRTGDEDQPALPLGPTWVLADCRAAPEQLVGDFDNVDTLRLLPTGFFDAVVFDWAVFKFFNEREGVLVELRRALKPAGALFFDDGLSEARVVASAAASSWSIEPARGFPRRVLVPAGDANALSSALAAARQQCCAWTVQGAGFASCTLCVDGDFPVANAALRSAHGKQAPRPYLVALV